MPGIADDQIDITVDAGVVRITGSRTDNQEDKSARRYFMNSMSSTYSYSFRLPEGLVSDEEPSAELNNGVLILGFKKMKKEPPKKVRVARKS